eukprot:1626774-Amphidinium_carterae.2
MGRNPRASSYSQPVDIKCVEPYRKHMPAPATLWWSFIEQAEERLQHYIGEAWTNPDVVLCHKWVNTASAHPNVRSSGC